MITPYNILITFSVLVVVSYIFNIVASNLKIPSVILLLATGIGLNFLGTEFGFQLPGSSMMLELLGITGLIFIVLEGSLDLKLTREKLPMVGKSLVSALLILLATSGIICMILYYYLQMPLWNSVAYAVPLGVISSAIAIPSVSRLQEEKREFIIYESTFSDILGIMLFNYVVLENVMTVHSVFGFFVDLLLILVISLLSAALLLLILNYTRSHVKFYLIFAIIILIYSIGKMFHLPSLMMVLVFGLMLNNASLFVKGRIAQFLHLERLEPVTRELKLITAETAFLIRTFFFLLFGFTINLYLLNDSNVVIVGSMIIFTILFTRFILLRFISHSNLFPGLFVAPRGLITIVLFYSIPPFLKHPAFNEGILFFVIILSAILMMVGLLAARTEYKEPIDELNH